MTPGSWFLARIADVIQRDRKEQPASTRTACYERSSLNIRSQLTGAEWMICAPLRASGWDFTAASMLWASPSSRAIDDLRAL